MQVMEDVRQFLASPRYARSLVFRMEDGTLVVGKGPAPSPADGELRIRCDPVAQQFVFAFLATPDDPDPWTRACEAGEWQRVLERILHKRLPWFHEG